MFVEVIPLQYQAWRKEMSSTKSLGLILGVPQLLHCYNYALRNYDAESDLCLSSHMANGGGAAAFRCAQLFCLEEKLNNKYGLGDDFKDLPRIVTGFWRMYELEFRIKPPTCFQQIPKIGLTIALDFGYESESVSAVRALLGEYECEGDICEIPVSKENWKDKVCAEVEMRFGSALKSYKDFTLDIQQPNKSADESFSSNDLDRDVPF